MISLFGPAFQGDVTVKGMTTLTAEAPQVYSSDDIIGLEREYLLQNYARYPLALERGKGCYVYDYSGKRYLDFIAGIGVNALGHAHPRITKAIREQAGRLIHTSNLYFHEYQGRLAKKLAESSGLQRSFFCNSGTEATEGALKMMRSHGNHINAEKIEIVSLENSFHGRSLGALSVTGQHKYRKDFEPLLTGVRFIRGNDTSALEQVMGGRTCGVLVEGIQGEGGINPMSGDFLSRCRQLCDKFDALLCFDETQCGVGRPGTYFSYQHFNPVILPDIMIAAKPLGCGIPLGCIVSNERASQSIAQGMHGSTFGGGVLACRVALEFFEELDKLLPAISQNGNYFRIRLNELKKKNPIIKDVRGEGLMIGMELTAPAKELVPAAMEQGLLINCTHDTVLRFLPPYIVTEREIDKAVSITGKLLKNFKPAQAAAQV
jgi:acetylornithine/N-succinyldiaminopimelate aminotransferase